MFFFRYFPPLVSVNTTGHPSPTPQAQGTGGLNEGNGVSVEPSSHHPSIKTATNCMNGAEYPSHDLDLIADCLICRSVH